MYIIHLRAEAQKADCWLQNQILGLCSPVLTWAQDSAFFFFLGLHVWRMEVPGLGVESVLQLPAYTTAIAMPDLSCLCSLHLSSRQCQILNPLSEAKDQTRNLVVLSRIR